MTWIKRNLFFAIGGVLALILLGAAGFYDFTSWKRNSTALDRLTEVYNMLKELKNHQPSPGNDKINNIETAKQQEAQLHDWIRQARTYFQPIAPIPNPTNGPISDPLFGDALHRTINQLQREATNANVSLPLQYTFSFQALWDRVKFAPGSLGPLATQLGEVKAISEILFAAGVNQLDGIQRMRVSDDDVNGPQTDYLVDSAVTNDLAVTTPYMITFRAFSPEIAQVLAGFASSPHGFIVKNINVQPAGAALMEPGFAMGGRPGMGMGVPPNMGVPPPTPVPGTMPGRGGLQTVLQEQLLQATIEVEIVKLLPKN
ncbi:MAG TPA: Amuc_1100 family pilus-like protein [Verrucomicrobiae bacterium]|nr:Amuc_1100 family pilus-like protein [Verrucomicrobiae bacterium]